MSMVQQAIEVSAPLHTVYEQLAAFENYPRFMTGVRQVTTTGADQTHWIMDVDGKRREFDAQIIERSPDERVSWSTMEGPLLAETLTLRPMGETKTQVVAQLEADIAFLMPSDRHGQESLNRRLKADLTTFKGLVESGVLGGRPIPTGASVKRLPGPSHTLFTKPDYASPASVATRVHRNAPTSPAVPHAPEGGPGAGWDTGAADLGNADPTGTGLADNPLHHAAGPGNLPGASAATGNLPGAVAGPGGPAAAKRGSGRTSGSAAGTARMGGRTSSGDIWGNGMINEEDRGIG
ncbi:SRPBCC family protein [Actinoplanes oblitus]|uniref:SRPBCC family protein n=1 Tax=Actinoplanes oblitus TaxID=3040509 RepID=A0ABY8WDX6_9ACTN|nr:SRPBCC family protein [Actinoplanes oblitus]WIM96071.1 SRPBCC family protein [Actinoplanes oblitus]